MGKYKIRLYHFTSDQIKSDQIEIHLLDLPQTTGDLVEFFQPFVQRPIERHLLIFENIHYTFFCVHQFREDLFQRDYHLPHSSGGGGGGHFHFANCNPELFLR